MAGTRGRACAAEVCPPWVPAIEARTGPTHGAWRFLCRSERRGPGPGIPLNLGTSCDTVTLQSLNAPDSARRGLDPGYGPSQTQPLLFKKMQIYGERIHKPLPITIFRDNIQWFSPLPRTLLEHSYHPQNESVCPLTVTPPRLYPFQPRAIPNPLPVSVSVCSGHFRTMEVP